jgi:hypothetical protein
MKLCHRLKVNVGAGLRAGPVGRPGLRAGPVGRPGLRAGPVGRPGLRAGPVFCINVRG